MPAGVRCAADPTGISESNQASSVYLTCYQVLEASQDPRAEAILRAGQRMLADDAARLSDERGAAIVRGDARTPCAAHRWRAAQPQ
jgi:hypothetical protein